MAEDGRPLGGSLCHSRWYCDSEIGVICRAVGDIDHLDGTTSNASAIAHPTWPLAVLTFTFRPSSTSSETISPAATCPQVNVPYSMVNKSVAYLTENE